MKHISRSLRTLASVFVLAGLSLSALSGQISGMVGEVLQVRSIVKAGDRNLKPKDVIRLQQEIQTFRASAVRMSFDGDGQLLLWPGTKVVLLDPGPASDRHHQCSQREVSVRIKLLRGDLQVDHDPAKVHRRPRIVEVETPDGFICLFGTSIQVHVERDFGTGVFVRETGAWVRHAEKRDWVELKASEQGFIRPGKAIRATRVPRFTLQDPEGRFLDAPLLDPIALGF